MSKFTIYFLLILLCIRQKITKNAQNFHINIVYIMYNEHIGYIFLVAYTKIRIYFIVKN